MAWLVAGLYYFFELFTPFNPTDGIFFVLSCIVVICIYIFLRKGWQGWQRQEITIGNRTHDIVTYHGAAARRVSSYFLFLGIFLLVVVLNELTLKLSFTVEPFRIYVDTDCIWNCVGQFKY